MPAMTFRNTVEGYIGKGSPLSSIEIDNNFLELLSRVIALETNPPTADQISSITQPTASTFTVHLESGASFGPFNLPVALFAPRTWAAETALSPLEVFGIAGSGVYMVLRAHTTDVGEVFDPDRLVDGFPAYHFLLPPGVQGPAGDNMAVGLFVDRTTYDAETIPFYYLSLDGYGNSGDPFVIFERDDAASDGWNGIQAGSSGGIPAYSVANNGQVLAIVAGIPTWVTLEAASGGAGVEELPSFGVGEANYVLKIIGGVVVWAPDETGSASGGGGGGFVRTVKTVTTDTYTLISGDELTRLRFTHAAGCVVTMPDNVFTDGAEIPMIATNDQLVLGGAAVPTHPADVSPISRVAGSQILAAYTSATTYDLTGDLELVSA